MPLDCESHLHSTFMIQNEVLCVAWLTYTDRAKKTSLPKEAASHESAPVISARRLLPSGNVSLVEDLHMHTCDEASY